ncbi:MAG: hypothetical protein ACKO5J_01665 [Rubrivivax sp.]
MSEVLRMTTEYVEAEDRLRVCCQLRSGETALLWVTQRLFLRVLPHLVEWLDKNTPGLADAQASRARADAVRGFTQQADRARHAPEAPVTPQAATQIWLVHTVDMTPREGELALSLRPLSRDAAAASFVLQPQALRVWLAMLAELFVRAGWPMEAWPAWLVPGPPRAAEEPGAVVH